MELLDIKQTAKQLKLSERWVRLMCQLGRVGTRVGSRWIITKTEVRRLKRRGVGRKRAASPRQRAGSKLTRKKSARRVR